MAVNGEAGKGRNMSDYALNPSQKRRVLLRFI